jgi:hypothetical protein
MICDAPVSGLCRSLSGLVGTVGTRRSAHHVQATAGGRQSLGGVGQRAASRALDVARVPQGDRHLAAAVAQQMLDRVTDHGDRLAVDDSPNVDCTAPDIHRHSRRSVSQ